MITNQILRVKSCPFCGGKVEASHIRAPFWFFECKNPKCGAVISFDCDRVNSNPDEALKLYDRRFGNEGL